MVEALSIHISGIMFSTGISCFHPVFIYSQDRTAQSIEAKFGPRQTLSSSVPISYVLLLIQPPQAQFLFPLQSSIQPSRKLDDTCMYELSIGFIGQIKSFSYGCRILQNNLDLSEPW
jgi:hypothetical protein